MSKIVVTDKLHDIGYELLNKESDIEVIDASNLDNLSEPLKDAKVVISRGSTKIDADFLDLAPSLDSIVRAGVGVENIDIDECSKRNIIVMNVPSANVAASTELAILHILNAARGFVKSVNHLMQDKNWDKNSLEHNEINSKKLGVIGFGHVGRAVSIICKSLGMDVVVYDPHVTSSKVTNAGVDYTVFFNDILKCDYITIHTPKNHETINIIDEESIAKMNDGVALINIAQGGLYNEDALYRNLKSGKIGYLGIDVFEQEPATSHPLLELPNVSATPHIKSNTVETCKKTSSIAAKQAILASRGISYQNPINLPLDTTNIPNIVYPFVELIQKISSLGGQINLNAVRSIQIQGCGEVASYLNLLMPLAISGVLRQSLGSNINYLNSESIANQHDILFDYSTVASSGAYKNILTLNITTNEKTIKISGTVFGDEILRIVDIDGICLDINPSGKMLVFQNSDVPGVIADISELLAKNKINIADFRLGRDGKGGAIAVVIVDTAVSKETLVSIEKLDTCIWTRYVEL